MMAVRLAKARTLEKRSQPYSGSPTPPAHHLEHRRRCGEQAGPTDRVEALPVVVEDHTGDCGLVFPASTKAFEDYCLVELGPSTARAILIRPGRGIGGLRTLKPSNLRHRGEQGHADPAEPDRAVREGDVFDVLGARRIGLRAAEGAKTELSFARLWCSEQVLDGVEDRRGVRLGTAIRSCGPQARQNRARSSGSPARPLDAGGARTLTHPVSGAGGWALWIHPGRQHSNLALQRIQAGALSEATRASCSTRLRPGPAGFRFLCSPVAA